jgi:hypothetical protein
MKIMIPNRRKQPVFHQYQNQCFPQTACLEFDPAQTGEIKLIADYSGEIDNAVPMDVWNNKILRFKIPSEVTLKALKELRSDKRLSNMLEQLREEYKVVWDGNNYVGRFDTDLYHGICQYVWETTNASLWGN